MKNEQSQIQQPSLLFEMKILRLATLLSEGDEGLDRDGLRLALDNTSVSSISIKPPLLRPSALPSMAL